MKTKCAQTFLIARFKLAFSLIYNNYQSTDKYLWNKIVFNIRVCSVYRRFLTMKAFVQSFAIIFRFFFLSFIKVEKDGQGKISHGWIAMNSLKLFGFSYLFFKALGAGQPSGEPLLFKTSRAFDRISVLHLQIIFLNLNWIFVIMKRKAILKSFNLAKELAERLNILNEFPEIAKISRNKSIGAFIVFQFFIFCELIYRFLFGMVLFRGILFLCARILIYSFMTLFYFATEFILTCLKILKKKLSRALKDQNNAILRSSTTKHQKNEAYDKLSFAVDSMSSFYEKIFELCKELEKSYQINILLLLLFQLSTISMEVYNTNSIF